MASQVTYTGVTGPGNSLTATVFSNITRLDFDYQAQVLTIYQGDTVNKVTLAGVTTITHSISGTNYTVTVS